MGRGQYDRAAAQAKRLNTVEVTAAYDVPQGGQPSVGALDADYKFGVFTNGKDARLMSLPPTETPDAVLVLRKMLATANERIAELERLCQTHGLMI